MEQVYGNGNYQHHSNKVVFCPYRSFWELIRINSHLLGVWKAKWADWLAEPELWGKGGWKRRAATLKLLLSREHPEKKWPSIYFLIFIVEFINLWREQGTFTLTVPKFRFWRQKTGNTLGKEIFARRPAGWGHSLCGGTLLSMHLLSNGKRVGIISPLCPCSWGL